MKVKKKIIGDEKVITQRPADLIEPELEKYRKEIGDLATTPEDVLSYVLFPQVAKKFFEDKLNCNINKNTSDSDGKNTVYYCNHVKRIKVVRIMGTLRLISKIIY